MVDDEPCCVNVRFVPNRFVLFESLFVSFEYSTRFVYSWALILLADDRALPSSNVADIIGSNIMS